MATYIIGDLHGCFDELQALLKQIDYQPKKDLLWFVGDIVNRGPKSLECLRFVKKLQKKGRAQMVLGNHDFHLIAAYSGLDKYQSNSDTLQAVLQADDAQKLIDWLRKQPLMVSHPLLDIVMVHAGIPPQWTIPQARAHAKEVEKHLQSADWQNFVTENLFGTEPDEWSDDLKSWGRIRYIANAFARMRYCDRYGKLDFKLKSTPSSDLDSSKNQFQPWFSHKKRKNRTHEIFFGHWSTLGVVDDYSIHSIDTGCLWGGKLTAYCLESNKRHTLKCIQNSAPKPSKHK